MAAARVRIPEGLKGLMRSELEKAIYESALSKEDDLIARRYLIEKVPQIDIAVELGYERSTISRRMPDIIKSVVFTAEKLKFT